MQAIRVFFLALCFHLSVFADESPLLTFKDIHPIMQEIFEQHLQVKQLDSNLFRESIQSYFEAFDPDKIYLLQEEIEPFINLNNEEVEAVVQSLQVGDYSFYEQVHEVIEESILRARSLRMTLSHNSDFFQRRAKEGKTAIYETYAKSNQELKERIDGAMREFINEERKRFGDSFVQERMEAVLTLYDKESRAKENVYLFLDGQEQILPELERENQLVIFILKALAKSLDAHSGFLDLDEAYEMRMRLEKSFDGVGIVLGRKGSSVVVSQIVRASPAMRSGRILEGDRILAINGKFTAGKTLDQVAQLLRGKAGSKVTLKVQREDEQMQRGNPVIQVILTREPIDIDEGRVKTSFVPFTNGIIGLIQLDSFYQGRAGVSSVDDVILAIEQLKKEGNLRGLILDLRENSGGFLNQAVQVAGLFITNGVIVVSKYNDGTSRFYRDLDGKQYFDGPLIVLTSRKTASAAEIVAQAIQDYGVGIVVGDDKTYGKGTVQTQNITEGNRFANFKVTVGTYYTVSGRSPQYRGVSADVVVPSGLSFYQIGERFEVNPMQAEEVAPFYRDELKDVKEDLLPWFVRYYIPTLQVPSTSWRGQLPDLRRNSEYRVARNEGYQKALSKMRQQSLPSSTLDIEVLESVLNRYQTQEAINVMKDMILFEPKARGLR